MCVCVCVSVGFFSQKSFWKLAIIRTYFTSVCVCVCVEVGFQDDNLERKLEQMFKKSLQNTVFVWGCVLFFLNLFFPLQKYFRFNARIEFEFLFDNFL